MFFPHALWCRALNSIEPGLTFDYFAGISAAPAELSVCAPGCDCRMRFALDRSARQAVASIGFRLTPLNIADLPTTQAAAHLAAAIKCGRPAMWSGISEGGLIVEALPDSSVRTLTWVPRAAQDTGELAWSEDICPLDSLRDAEVVIVTRSHAPRGLRSHRETRALLEWTAASLRPRARGGCITGGPLRWHAGGLEAYELWSDVVKERSSGIADESRTQEWRACRQKGTGFLRAISGGASTRYANRLRTAAALYEEEAGIFNQILPDRPKTNRRTRGDTMVAAIRKAKTLAERAALLVGEAALLRVGLPPHVEEALLESVDRPVEGTLLNEIVYLAIVE